MGVFVGEFPDKPEELRLYELTEKTGLPLVAGGLLDQPHMWLDAIEMIGSIRKIYEIQAETNANAATRAEQTSDLMKPMRFMNG